MELSFDFHSPVEPLKFNLFEKYNLTVHIKRDDMIHPFISGNKWRKLKYTLLDAKKENKTHLVTFGGAWSNHLLATAAAAAKFGFTSTAYVRGESVENQNLNLCKLFGMELKFVSRENYRNKENIFNKYHRQDSTTYFINEGGASVHALKGCVEIIDELPFAYDHIFTACGTGTTLAGLAIGVKNNRLHTRLNGVPVLANGAFLYEDINRLDNTIKDVMLHTDYHFGGYAKTKPALLTFIKHFVSKTGILIEPVYTGKMLFCLFDLIEKKYFPPNSSILVLHTGGMTGILGKLDSFGFNH
ncbi:1-aminocyclopropane-1-carboxylate deaminase/D-cysteine desulfhydrase [Olivibacter sp. SDN3]|nr:pyridoxal-phosphate dependent enzyme [Olivibacter sp. SDN3]QNL52605.1 1-aminocyclopropane-1-carboxylate deaminase/D-cysteine desulfhydrase [Olivibacter sp. SDN3]